MSSNRDFKTICKKYFTPMENDIFKCKCGKILKQKKGTGWSNLMVHIRTQHETTAKKTNDRRTTISHEVGGNRSKEWDRKSELVLRSTIPNF